MPVEPETRTSTPPLPDPTERTIQQLEEKISGLKELIVSKLDAAEKATDLRLRVADDVPAMIARELGHLEEKFEVRFESIDLRFVERDVRTNQAATASDQALQAALQAAKELVTAQGESSSAAAVKSETSFTKQIDQIITLIQTQGTASDARITELKERIDRGEGGQVAVQQNTDNRAQATGLQMAMISLAIAFVGALIAAAVAFA